MASADPGWWRPAAHLRIPPRHPELVTGRGAAGYDPGMANRAAEDAPGPVGTEPAGEVLAASGIVVTAEGKARWRRLLSEPIPEEALAEGRAMLDETRQRVYGNAA